MSNGKVRSASKTGLPGLPASVPAARAMPATTGLTNSRWLGFGRHRDLGVGVELAQGAGMVLHVARPPQVDAVPRAGLHRVLVLGQDLLVGLAQHVREHVEATPVRHADQHVSQARVVGVLDDRVEDGHEHVEPFHREAGLAGERPVQEPLERLDLGDAVEQGLDVDGGHRRAEAAGLDGQAQPLALLGDEHLGEVVPGARAVGPAQGLDGRRGVRVPFGQRPADDAGGQAQELLLGDAVRLGRQRRVASRA